jgi:hypothetical protein
VVKRFDLKNTPLGRSPTDFILAASFQSKGINISKNEVIKSTSQLCTNMLKLMFYSIELFEICILLSTDTSLKREILYNSGKAAFKV